MRGVNRIFIPLLILLVISLPSNAYATGEAGAQFLKIGVGAKASAMGEAFVGVADDATAIYWNPAGLTRIRSVELLGMQNFYLMDMGYQYVAAALPSRYGSLGAAIAYSSSGEIPRYENFQHIGEYTAYDAAVTIAYADRLNKAISYGIALKMIRQKIEEEKATGFAADIGLLYKVEFIKGMKTGLLVQNLGPGIKFIEEQDPLPQNVKLGIGYERGPFTFAVDLGKPKDNDFKVNLGGEFSIKDILALRAGYNSANSYSAGLGLRWQKVSIDYAYVPYKDIDDSHLISVKVRF
ncbi:PorV/PorQ family protein [bacterium]|nr:PorV/PorQ family protein [bacterium]